MPKCFVMSILPLWANRAQSHWGNFQKLCETHVRTFPPEETEEGWIIYASPSTLLPAMVESRSRSLNFFTLALQRREIGMLPGKAVLTLEILWGAGSLGRMCSPFTRPLALSSCSHCSASLLSMLNPSSPTPHNLPNPSVPPASATHFLHKEMQTSLKVQGNKT